MNDIAGNEIKKGDMVATSQWIPFLRRSSQDLVICKVMDIKNNTLIVAQIRENVAVYDCEKMPYQVVIVKARGDET